MNKPFLFAFLMSTTILAGNVYAVDCPVDSCYDCGSNCKAYTESGTLHIIGTKKILYSDWPDKSSVTKVVIENGITNVAPNAFSGMTSVTSLTIQDGVTSIGTGAFSNMNVSNITCSAENLEIYFNEYGGLTVGSDGKINITCTSGDCESVINTKYGNNNTIMAALNFVAPSTNEPGGTSGQGNGSGNGSGTGNSTAMEQNPDGSYTIYNPDGSIKGFKGKRIYTVQEAEMLSKPVGNTIKLRYK